MATAGDVANRALKRILTQGADAPFEADEYADFLGSMNSYMDALAADGIVLGYTTVTNVADEVTIPDGAIRGLVAVMAVEVAPDFGGFVSPELLDQKQKGEATLKRIGRPKRELRYPTTLPMGSGLTEETLRTSSFYETQIEAQVALSGNARETELPTIGTAVLVNGFWQVVRAQGFNGDIRGQIANGTQDDQSSTVKFSGYATGNGTYSLILRKNNVQVKTSSATLTSTPSLITFNHTLTLSPNDYVDLAFKNDTDTNGATMTDAQLRVVA